MAAFFRAGSPFFCQFIQWPVSPLITTFSSLLSTKSDNKNITIAVFSSAPLKALTKVPTRASNLYRRTKHDINAGDHWVLCSAGSQSAKPVETLASGDVQTVEHRVSLFRTPMKASLDAPNEAFCGSSQRRLNPVPSGWGCLNPVPHRVFPAAPENGGARCYRT